MYVLTEPDGDVSVVISWSFNQNVFSALILIHSNVRGIIPPFFLSYYVLSPTLPVKFRTHFWASRESSCHPYLALLSACVFSANERTQFCQVSECFLGRWGFGTFSKWWLWFLGILMSYPHALLCAKYEGFCHLENNCMYSFNSCSNLVYSVKLKRGLVSAGMAFIHLLFFENKRNKISLG